MSRWVRVSAAEEVARADNGEPYGVLPAVGNPFAFATLDTKHAVVGGDNKVSSAGSTPRPWT